MSRLRAVKPDERPPAAVPKTITAALAGSERDVWAAMRKALAVKIDSGEVAPNAIGSTYRELRELDRLIREFDRRDEGGASDGDDDEPFDSAAI